MTTNPKILNGNLVTFSHKKIIADVHFSYFSDFTDFIHVKKIEDNPSVLLYVL